MAEDKPKYDFNFICLSLGLIPINNGCAAIAPGAITHCEIERSGKAIITVHGGQQFELEPEQMAELEKTITQRTIDSKILQRAAMEEQMIAQYELSQKIQNGVQRAAGIITSEKRRH